MNDTNALLREACLTSAYAAESIQMAKEYAEDRGLKTVLGRFAEEHRSIKRQLEEELRSRGVNELPRPTITKSISKIRTGISLSMNPESDNIARLVLDGCTTGMKSLSKSKNRHPAAEPESVRLTNELIKSERDMFSEMLRYLK